MEPTNYYNELKYCPECQLYVRYLMSLAASYCVACGNKVQLFSQDDREQFLTNIKPQHKTAVKTHKKRVS